MTASDRGGTTATPGAGIAGTIGGDLRPCWQCGHSVAPRALFCHGCGAVQAPREGVDHFARLGLERRFDIDLDQLARQHAGFARALDPARFAARGARQQALARQQAEAMAAAHVVLRDPVRRARYLLELAGEPLAPSGPDPDTAAILARLAGAAEAMTVDRLAAELANRIETGIRALAAAFRAGRTAEAATLLARLESLETAAATARDRRAGLAPLA